MQYLFYVRLIALTAGTLVYLFLLALILGHRRPRLFERLLFFLVLARFLIYAGGLLEIHAISTPHLDSARLFTSLDLLGTPFYRPFIHLHVEYIRTIQKADCEVGSIGVVLFLFSIPKCLGDAYRPPHRLGEYALGSLQRLAAGAGGKYSVRLADACDTPCRISRRDPSTQMRLFR